MAIKSAKTVFKRSSVPAKAPIVSDLELGEVAINTNDGKMFIKKNNGTESIVLINNYDPANVAITGGTINNTTIGATTATTGRFTTATADLFQANLAAPAGSSTIGGLAWNDADGTLEFKLKGGNVDLQIGQEQVIRVTNQTGVTVTDGQVVYISGALGLRPTVQLADASTFSTSLNTIGLVTEVIANNNQGFITTSGLVRGIDTSMFAEGAELWLSETAGAMTTTVPLAPAKVVRIGWCAVSHAVNGAIFVAVQVGTELSKLHDVLVTSPAAGQLLTYDTTLSLWKNGGNVTITGGTLNNVSITGSTGSFTTLSTSSDLYANGLRVGLGNSSISTSVAIGASALAVNTTGNNNVAIGATALSKNTTGSLNTAIGADALSKSINCSNLVAIGGGSLAKLVYGQNTLAIGKNSLNNIGQAVPAGSFILGKRYIIGFAGDTNWVSIGASNNNVGSTFYATGPGSGTGIAAAGFNNTAIGADALLACTTGFGNTAIGLQTQNNAISAYRNTSVGSNALTLNRAGALNIAIGPDALYYAGQQNTAPNLITGKIYEIASIGTSDFTLVGATSNTVGLTFTATGTTTGTGVVYPRADYNVAIGYQAGGGNNSNAGNTKTGSNNTFIGTNTIAASSSDDNTTVIGYNAVGLGSNSTVIGNSSTIITKVFGKLIINDAPASSIGAAGDVAGMIAVDANYIYHCTATYDGSTSIWKRLAGTTW